MLAFVNYRWPELNFDRCNEVFVYNTSKFWKHPVPHTSKPTFQTQLVWKISDQVWDLKKFAKLTEG